MKFPTLVSLKGMAHLIDGWWNLESAHEDSLLSLDSDISWPLHKSSQVTLGLNISTDSEVSWVLGEEGILSSLLRLLGSSGCCHDLAYLGKFLDLAL
jgi:hypothetical protein